MCPFVKNAGLLISKPNVTSPACPAGVESVVTTIPVDPTTSWPPINYGPVAEPSVIRGWHNEVLDE